MFSFCVSVSNNVGQWGKVIFGSQQGVKKYVGRAYQWQWDKKRESKDFRKYLYFEIIQFSLLNCRFHMRGVEWKNKIYYEIEIDLRLWSEELLV